MWQDENERFTHFSLFSIGTRLKDIWQKVRGVDYYYTTKICFGFYLGQLNRLVEERGAKKHEGTIFTFSQITLLPPSIK